jgi:hydrogenase maturation protease
VTSVVVVGVGNAYRGDDAAGLAVAERIRGRVPVGVAVVECEQEPTRLLDAWHAADVALVVDAATSGAPPGTVHRFDTSEGPLPARVFRSSPHAFGVGDAVELARALGRLPGRVVVYGIEGADFTAGAALSAPVEAAVGRVVAEVEEEVRCTNGR